MGSARALGEGVMSREPGDGEGQGNGTRKRTRRPRPSPSQLSPEEALVQARAAALRLLAHRERSRGELRSRLSAKGYDRVVVDRVLDRLEEAGLQSDGRFAETFAADAQRGRGLSSLAVQGELRRRGVGRDLAAEAATERPEDEEARARNVAARRAGRMTGLPREVLQRRIVGFLARRGYPPDLCRRIAAEVAETSGENGQTDGPDRRVP